MSTLKVPVTSQDHVQGNAKAICTLLEYGDFECPHCGAAFELVKELQAHFGKRLRLVFRNFPLTKIHANAQAAAEAAEFAGSHGKYWEMHDLLFKNQDRLGDELYSELASNLKLDSGKLQESLASGRFADRVRTDFLGGVRSGVNGTPTFYINDQRYDDSMDLASMIAAIEKSIAS